MIKPTFHKFHIPVMGLGFTIDTPLKVARYGISSVMSIVEDGIIEQMREFYCNKAGFPYLEIANTVDDYRAKRITAYLNLVHFLINEQVKVLRTLPFEDGSDIVKYFELLPDDCEAKKKYQLMLSTEDETEKNELQDALRTKIVPGTADVNIMAKVDKNNYDKNEFNMFF